MAEGGPGASYEMGEQCVLVPPDARPHPDPATHRQYYSRQRRYVHRGATQPPSGGPSWSKGATGSLWRILKNEETTYGAALSRLDDCLRTILLLLPTDLAAALRQELDGYNGLNVG